MVIINKNLKESLVRKVLENPEKSISEIAREAHISKSTLYGWVKRAKESTKYSASVVHSTLRAASWTREQRFQTLMDTATLSGEVLNQYCREKGLYIQWRHDFMNSCDEQQKRQTKELKQLREQNKALQRELRRKEKALAETTALLVLKKKADLIWGGNEDD